MSFFDRFMFATTRPRVAFAAAAIAAVSGNAQATWSILIADTRTGEIVIGSATCVELINLQQSTPVLISGVGAVTAQSAVDITGMNRQVIRDRLLQGVPLDTILEELAMSDGGHNNRQYGFITARGQTLTYSGIQNAAWAGGQTGRIERGSPGPADDIVYAVQGNILSGSNVVQAAVDAIVASSGDLPQMMMDGMQAAKTAGGDGRCSCSNADPTGCGSPPPAPFKSADVGYMLGTRAGDIDAIRAIYPTDELIGDLETIDLDGDGFAEVVVGSATSSTIWVYRNTAMPGDPLSTLELWQTISGPASETVAMNKGDFDGDGTMEVVVAHTNPPRLSVYSGDGLGSIANPSTIDLPATPTSLDLWRYAPDFAVVPMQNNEIRSYELVSGSLSEFDVLDLGFTPGGIAIDELGEGYFTDLAVCNPAGNAVHVYNGGELGFSLVSSFTTSNDPVKVQIADMDQDGDNEIIVLCGAGRRAEVYSLENDQWVPWGSASLFGTGIGLDVGDMSGDGFPDIVTTYAGTNRNLQLFISDGAGGFMQQSRTRVGSGARSLRLHDMNNNGNLDIVVGNGGSDGVMILDNAQGIALPQPGRFADGEYFMSLNVPNQRRSDPDPVDQLQDLYDAWLLDRVGAVDAVRSSVYGRGLIDRNSTTLLRIELRDLNDDLLEISDPAQLDLSISEPIAIIGMPVLVEPGVFDVEIVGGDEIGGAQLTVRAGPEGDRVPLMPQFPVGVVASLADFNADGVCNFFDVVLFIQAWYNQDPNADIVPSFVWDFHDVAAFLQAYNACTPG